jgi:hypothetical protein
MSTTLRDDTRNQGAFDRLLSNLLILNNTFLKGDYANISGALETVAVGQLLGRVAATGKLVVCKSGATDGSAIPRAINVVALEDVAIAGTVDNIAPCNGGKVNKHAVVFNGTDTWDTLVGGIRMEDLLIANSASLELVDVLENTDYDN